MKDTKLQKYADIQAMVQQEIRSLFGPLYSQYAKQFGVNKVPTHTHNGTDAVRISEADLQKNIKFGAGLNTQASETFYLKAIPNLSYITMYGFAANNLSVAATKRVISNGHAAFGRCFAYDTVGATVTPSTSQVGIPIIQGANGMFVDSTSLANNRVSFSDENIFYATDSAGTVVASLKVDSYENGILQITSVLATDWQIFFHIIMS